MRLCGPCKPSSRRRSSQTSRRSPDWASITFSGARHHIPFTIMGEEAEKAAHRLLSRLSETEFSVPGHILADIGLLSRQPSRTPGGLSCVSVTIEALTVEDC
jgi:hypothetical protein